VGTTTYFLPTSEPAESKKSMLVTLGNRLVVPASGQRQQPIFFLRALYATTRAAPFL